MPDSADRQKRHEERGRKEKWEKEGKKEKTQTLKRGEDARLASASSDFGSACSQSLALVHVASEPDADGAPHDATQGVAIGRE